MNPLQLPDWNERLIHHDDCTPFHTSNWARVLCDSYGYEPRYVTLRNNGRFDGVLPVLDVHSILTGRRGVSLPFSDLCGPLADTDDRAAQLFHTAVELGRQYNWRYYELRSDRVLPLGMEPSAQHLEHLLQLDPGEHALFSSLHKNTRRAVKKASAQGVTSIISSSLDATRAYHRLNEMTRRQHGLPPQPWSFFKNIHRYVISKGMGIVSLAMHEGRPVAGSVYFHFNKRAFYKYAASHPKYVSLRAGFLSAWEAIRWHVQHGYKTLSFGKTEPDNSGLRRFKLGWGSEERPLSYYRWNIKQNRSAKMRSRVTGPHNTVFRKMPLTLARCIGTALYRHMG